MGITIAIVVTCMALAVIAYLMFTKMQRLEKQLQQHQQNKSADGHGEQEPQPQTMPPQNNALPPTDSNLFKTYSAKDLPENLQEMALHAANQIQDGNFVAIDPQKLTLQRGQTTYINLVTETQSESQQLNNK